MRKKLQICLDSLHNAQYDRKYEIIVVNKPSNDGTEFLLSNMYPLVKLISHPKFGVGEMRNVGIRYSSGKYLLMLDSDTKLLDNGFEKVIKFMDENLRVAALGCKLVDSDLNLQYSCRTFYDLKTIVYRRTPIGKFFHNSAILRKHLMLYWDHNNVREVDWVQGACLFMRRKAIEDIGFFTEISSFGFEDVDWCYRAKLRNWKVYYVPFIRVIHEYQRDSANIFSKKAFEHLLAGINFYLKYHFRIKR